MPRAPQEAAETALAADTALAGDTAESGPRETQVLLARPQTYMNRSGYAARCLVERHDLAPEAVLVVYDEIDLPLGRLRLRRAGSPAGHRGMESVIENLRTEEVPRLRVGIAPAVRPSAEELAEFLLSPFTAEEREQIDEAVQRAADACEVWRREGLEAAMRRFN